MAEIKAGGSSGNRSSSSGDRQNTETGNWAADPATAMQLATTGWCMCNANTFAARNLSMMLNSSQEMLCLLEQRAEYKAHVGGTLLNLDLYP